MYIYISQKSFKTLIRIECKKKLTNKLFKNDYTKKKLTNKY